MARRASPRAPPPQPWWLSSVPVLGVHLVRVVHHRGQDHADRLLFVPEHRTQPPLPASLSSSDWPPAESVHHGDTCNKRDDHANLFEPGCCGCCGCFQDGLSEEVCIHTLNSGTTRRIAVTHAESVSVSVAAGLSVDSGDELNLRHLQLRDCVGA